MVLSVFMSMLPLFVQYDGPLGMPYRRACVKSSSSDDGWRQRTSQKEAWTPTSDGPSTRPSSGRRNQNEAVSIYAALCSVG
jgi:hypothetical protein